jgi:hypothetical protein
VTLNDRSLLVAKLLISLYFRKYISFVEVVGRSLVLILIRVIALAIAVATGFGVVSMSIVAENNVYAQWIIPWQLRDAYKQQQHIEGNNQTKILAAERTILHQVIKPIPEK